MDERIVYDNVGYPTINGSHGVMRFWHRIFGRRSAGFEAKIHRIAVDGLSVLTERTDVMVFGPAAAIADLGVRCVRGLQRQDHFVA